MKGYVATMTTRSFEKINYGLRPAKSIERKMICDACRRLSEIAQLKSYRYIGFGSTYFSDFVLLHKALGLRDMTSIEKQVAVKERFTFNNPFKCIKVEFGTCGDVLRRLTWNDRSLIWLDYDGKLDEGVLSDVSFCAANVPTGSALVVSVNVQPEAFSGTKVDEKALSNLKDRVTEDKVPPDINAQDLEDWGTARVSKRILDNEIAQSLAERNGVKPLETKMHYKQIFNFHYRDGARMLNVGGILVDGGMLPSFAKCDFPSLDFVRTGDDPYTIEVPNLTYREMRFLDKQLPIDDPKKLKAEGVPIEDLERYERIYRYFPTFAEAEI